VHNLQCPIGGTGPAGVECTVCLRTVRGLSADSLLTFFLADEMSSIVSDLGTSSGPNTTTTDDAQHFFKVTWPEIHRDKEPRILRVALDRAAKYLPVEHQEAVTGHLSNIVRFEEVEGTSTATIRRLLGLPTTDSRVQLWTISKKLSGLETLLDPMEFWKAIWEIIRCMLNFTVRLLLSTDSIMIRPLPTMADWYCSWRH